MLGKYVPGAVALMTKRPDGSATVAYIASELGTNSIVGRAMNVIVDPTTPELDVWSRETTTEGCCATPAPKRSASVSELSSY